MDKLLSQHLDWLNEQPTGKRLDVSDQDLSMLDFSGKNLTRSVFRGAKLVSADFSMAVLNDVDFRNANLSFAYFSQAEIAKCDFAGTIGLFGPRMIRVVQPLRGLDRARPCNHKPRGCGRRYIPHWYSLKALRDVPFFAVSNLMLVVLIVYAKAVPWVNHNLDVLRQWLSSNTVLATPIPEFSDLPIPRQFGCLLVAMLALLCASVIFRTACPEVVLTFSNIEREDKYIYRIEYESANYSRWKSRLSCSCLFIGGGAYTVLYFGARAHDALVVYFGSR